MAREVTHPIHRLPRGEVHVARAEAVYPLLSPGSVRLVISDGPYGMGKADWDRQRGPDGLREWYAPHVEAWGRVCADAASVYLWGTQAGVRALQPLMEAHGWTWRTSIVWDKGVAYFAGRINTDAMRTYYDVTESCDVYTREPWNATAARSDVRAAGLRPRDIDAAAGVACMASRKWLGTDAQAQPPSSDDLAAVRAALPSLAGQWRLAEPRVPFAHPVGVGNVWIAPSVAGRERLPHPCQKPVTFYGRIIRASSRPGDLVLEPFGGTLRAAVAIETMPDADARRYVCIEPDEDGRGYVPAALTDLRARMASPGLWGGA